MIKNLLVLFCMFARVGSESCKAFQIKKEHLNKRLIGHEISELIVKGHHDCVRECFYLLLCKSTDYYKRENTCKLNDADSKSVQTTEFEDKPGAVFSDITEWPSGMAGVCGQRPCSGKQKCFPDKDGYQCKVACVMVPTIENGVVSLDKAGDMLYKDTATVTCHDGYRTDKLSIQCQASGTWESVSCDRKSCGIVPTIEYGVVELNNAGEMLYMDKATVWCHRGYGPVKPSIQCQASGTWESVSCEMITDCKDMHQYFPSLPNGVYEIKLGQSLTWKSVFCDMVTDGGGWTEFQSRSSGTVDFYRNFLEYENGFGTLFTEFWIGLKYVHEMVSQGETELRMDLMAADGSEVYETFQNFSLDAGPEYTLHIDPGTGTAGDDATLGLSSNNGHHFSTKDAERDEDPNVHCANLLLGAWWYSECGGTNLNGEYVTPGTTHTGYPWSGMLYHPFKGQQSLKFCRMMFRRV